MPLDQASAWPRGSRPTPTISVCSKPACHLCSRSCRQWPNFDTAIRVLRPGGPIRQLPASDRRRWATPANADLTLGRPHPWQRSPGACARRTDRNADITKLLAASRISKSGLKDRRSHRGENAGLIRAADGEDQVFSGVGHWIHPKCCASTDQKAPTSIKQYRYVFNTGTNATAMALLRFALTQRLTTIAATTTSLHNRVESSRACPMPLEGSGTAGRRPRESCCGNVEPKSALR